MPDVIFTDIMIIIHANYVFRVKVMSVIIVTD